jgi:flagellar motor switch protein FliM
MEKVLTQDEIDALFRTAQSGSSNASPERQRRVSPFDLRSASQLTAEQVRSVNTLHEAFARRVGGSLGAFLRVGLEMNLVSVEQIAYGEFLGRLPELTYLASIHIQPLEARATIQTDLSLAFPMVDLVLGGSGQDQPEVRDLTEIEEEIIETITHIVCRELQSTWNPVLQLEFQFEQRQQQTQVQSLMLPTEKILSLSFEIRLPGARGTLNLAFPAVVSNALLRKLSVQWSYFERTASRQNELRLRDHLLDSSFEVDLSLPPNRVPVRELLNLEPGSVLMLQQRISDPIYLSVAGKQMFQAQPVRCGPKRGAQVQKVLSIVNKQGKETK